MTKKQNTRTRNFVSILYPESAKEDWLDILRELCVQAFVSPLHDRDYDKDGKLKKPHYHIMLMFDGVKTRAQAQELYDAIGAVACQEVKSFRAQARYLCHLDDLDKAQYETSDVKCIAGADYMKAIEQTTDKYKAMQDMIVYCRDNDITAYSDLLDYCITEHLDWFRILCDDSSHIVQEYMKSVTWKRREEKNRPIAVMTNDGKKFVDLETGEAVSIDEAKKIFGS